MPGALLGGCFPTLEVSFCQEVLSSHLGCLQAPPRGLLKLRGAKRPLLSCALPKPGLCRLLKSPLIILSSEFPIKVDDSSLPGL